MFSHVLVGIDFSPATAPLLRGLSALRDLGCEQITLAHVLETRSVFSRPSADDRNDARERLEDAAAALVEAGYRVQVAVVEGRPATSLLRVADEHGAGAVLVANRGYGPLREVLVGGAATELLERADRPVFLYRLTDDDIELDAPGRAPGRLFDVLVHPTDYSPASRPAFEQVAKLASGGRRVVLAHVYSDELWDLLGPKLYEERLEGYRQAMATMQETLLERGAAGVELILESGNARERLVELSRRYPRGLFVMGSQGKGRIADLVLGGVARALVRQGVHHVLIVPEVR